MQFQIDGANNGAPDTVAPYTVNYDTRGLVNGAHTFSAVITDRVGNAVTITRAVTFANAPVVVVTTPGNGATVTRTISFTANVTQYGTGPSSQFKVDGGNVGSAQGGTGALTGPNIDTTTLGNGSHTFSVTTTDAQGNTATGTNTVTVSNAPALPNTPGPNNGGYVNLSDGDVAQGGYGPTFAFGTWASQGWTLQFRFHGNYSGDQYKSPHFDMWINDGSNDQYSTRIDGAGTTTTKHTGGTPFMAWRWCSSPA